MPNGLNLAHLACQLVWLLAEEGPFVVEVNVAKLGSFNHFGVEPSLQLHH